MSNRHPTHIALDRTLGRRILDRFGEARIVPRWLRASSVETVSSIEDVKFALEDSPTAVVQPFKKGLTRWGGVNYKEPSFHSVASLRGTAPEKIINYSASVAALIPDLDFGDLNNPRIRRYQNYGEANVVEYYQTRVANSYLLRFLEQDLKSLSRVEVLPESDRKPRMGFEARIGMLSETALGEISGLRDDIRKAYDELAKEKDSEDTPKYIRSEEEKHIEAQGLFPNMEISFKVNRRYPVTVMEKSSIDPFLYTRKQVEKDVVSEMTLRFDSKELSIQEQDALYVFAAELKKAAASGDNLKVDQVYSKIFDFAEQKHLLEFSKLANLTIMDIRKEGSIFNGMHTEQVTCANCVFRNVHALYMRRDMTMIDCEFTGLHHGQIWQRVEHYGVYTRRQDYSKVSINEDAPPPVFKPSINPYGKYRREDANFYLDYGWKHPLRWLELPFHPVHAVLALPAVAGFGFFGGYSTDIRDCKFPPKSRINDLIKEKWQQENHIFREFIHPRTKTKNADFGDKDVNELHNKGLEEKGFRDDREDRPYNRVRNYVRRAHLGSSTYKITLPDSKAQLECVGPNQNVWVYTHALDKGKVAFSIYLAESDKEGNKEFKLLRGPYTSSPSKLAVVRSFLINMDRWAGKFYKNPRYKGQHHEFRERDLTRVGTQISSALIQFGFTKEEDSHRKERIASHFNISKTEEERELRREMLRNHGAFSNPDGKPLSESLNTRIEKAEAVVEALGAREETRANQKKLAKAKWQLAKLQKAKELLDSHPEFENRNLNRPKTIYDDAPRSLVAEVSEVPAMTVENKSKVTDVLECLRRKGLFSNPVVEADTIERDAKGDAEKIKEAYLQKLKDIVKNFDRNAYQKSTPKELRELYIQTRKASNGAGEIKRHFDIILPRLREFRDSLDVSSEPINVDNANAAVGFIEKFKDKSVVEQENKDGKKETKLDTKDISKYDDTAIGWEIAHIGTQYLTNMFVSLRDVLNTSGTDVNYAYMDRIYSVCRTFRTLAREDCQPYLIYTGLLEISAGIAEAITEHIALGDSSYDKKQMESDRCAIHAALTQETCDYIANMLGRAADGGKGKFGPDQIKTWGMVSNYLVSAAAGQAVQRKPFDEYVYDPELKRDIGFAFPDYDQRRKLSQSMSKLGAARFISDSKGGVDVEAALRKHQNAILQSCGTRLHIKKNASSRDIYAKLVVLDYEHLCGVRTLSVVFNEFVDSFKEPLRSSYYDIVSQFNFADPKFEDPRYLEALKLEIDEYLKGKGKPPKLIKQVFGDKILDNESTKKLASSIKDITSNNGQVFYYGRQTYFIKELIEAQKDSMMLNLLNSLTPEDLLSYRNGRKVGDILLERIDAEEVKHAECVKAKREEIASALAATSGVISSYEGDLRQIIELEGKNDNLELELFELESKKKEIESEHAPKIEQMEARLNEIKAIADFPDKDTEIPKQESEISALQLKLKVALDKFDVDNKLASKIADLKESRAKADNLRAKIAEYKDIDAKFKERENKLAELREIQCKINPVIKGFTVDPSLDAIDRIKLRQHLTKIAREAAEQLNRFDTPVRDSGKIIRQTVVEINKFDQQYKKVEKDMKDVPGQPKALEAINKTRDSYLKKQKELLIIAVASADMANNLTSWVHALADVRDSGRGAFAPVVAQWMANTNIKPSSTKVRRAMTEDIIW